MSKTMETRAVIQMELKTLCNNVYFDSADKDVVFPYLTYTLEEISHTDGTTLCELEINVVDYGSDTMGCETLCDNIQKVFDHFQHIDKNVMLQIYRGRRQPIQEEDKKIIRRRMTFEVRLHERG